MLSTPLGENASLQAEEETAVSLAENKALVRRFIEAPAEAYSALQLDRPAHNQSILA